MHPVTVYPTRSPREWRRPAVLAAAVAGLAASAVYLWRHRPPPSLVRWRARLAAPGAS